MIKTSILFTLLALFTSSIASAAATYTVQDFSPAYYATVTIKGDLKDIFVPGTVKVYKKRAKPQLLP